MILAFVLIPIVLIFLGHSIFALVDKNDNKQLGFKHFVGILIGAISTLILLIWFSCLLIKELDSESTYEKVEFEVYKKINNK